MKKAVAILCLLLMMLQAIPVLHFFSSQKEVFYAYIDEEKPTEKAMDAKACVPLVDVAPPATGVVLVFAGFAVRTYQPPLLESMTPPPDAC